MYAYIYARNHETRRNVSEHIECADLVEAFQKAEKLAISIDVGLYQTMESKSGSNGFIGHYDNGHTDIEQTTARPKTAN